MAEKRTMVGQIHEVGTGAALLDAMLPFIEWSTMQGPEVRLRVLASVVAIEEVFDEVRQVPVLRDFALPDCWAMEQAATSLRDLAQAAGFAAAAVYCEQMRQQAAELIAMAEQLFREAQEAQQLW